MESKSKSQKLKEMKPTPPQHEDEFQKDLIELKRLQEMNEDMQRVEELLKFKLMIEEQTIMQGYGDMMEIIAYKGLCMIKHVAQEALGNEQRQAMRQRPARMNQRSLQQVMAQLRELMEVGEQDVINSSEENSQDLTEIELEQLRQPEVILGQRLPANLLNLPPQPNQQPFQNQSLIDLITEGISILENRSPQNDQGQRRRRRLAFPIQQEDPELWRRLTLRQNDELLMDVIEEFNRMIDDSNIATGFGFFLEAREPEGPMSPQFATFVSLLARFGREEQNPQIYSAQSVNTLMSNIARGRARHWRAEQVPQQERRQAENNNGNQ